MIRFLHAADLHLGARITRFDESTCERIVEARFAALQEIRKQAVDFQAQFILIAGDLFDDHSISRSDAGRTFALLEGKEGACPVFVIPGNHDPLVPGGVWDRDPWLREQPHLRVKLIRTAEPVSVPNLPVQILPCPLRQRRSMDDPTAWIAQHPRTDPSIIRIGLAHGSLRVMPLPDDDHLIRPDAAECYDLDYLALGHWHKVSRWKSSDGVERTAYCGTHEPMRFAGAHAEGSTGWASYSADGDAERFHDDGHGTVLGITIDGPFAPPKIESLEVGRLRWRDETRDLTRDSLSEVIKHYSEWENPERTILRLHLSGVVAPQRFSRIEELEKIVLGRYHPGSSIDTDGVMIEPNAEQLSEVVGDGVLRRVLDRLKDESQSTESGVKRVAEHALKLLYQIACKEQPR